MDTVWSFFVQVNIKRAELACVGGSVEKRAFVALNTHPSLAALVLLCSGPESTLHLAASV